MKIRISSWSVSCVTWRPSALALTAAETGHLVFGTLHTSSAAKTIDRVIDVFPAGEKAMVRLDAVGVAARSYRPDPAEEDRWPAVPPPGRSWSAPRRFVT